MKNDVVETVKSYFTSSLVSQLSTLVDETEPSVRKALNKSVPLVLKGLLNRVERGFSPDALLDLVHAAESAQVLKQLANPQGSTWGEQGTDLLLDLLGTNYRNTVQEVAVAAAIRPKASGTLMLVVATAVLGVLGRVAVENNFTAVELTSWLRAQNDAIGSALLKNAIETALTPPLAGTQAIADNDRQLLRQPAPPVPAVQAPAPAYEQVYAPETPSSMRWQWGALLLVAVCLGYFFGRGYFSEFQSAVQSGPSTVASLAPGTSSGYETRTSTVPGARSAAPSSPSPTTTVVAGRYDAVRDRYIFDTGKPIELTLANGTKQQVGINSTENRLFSFLASEEQVDSVNRTKGWINLDRVNFESGKSTLTPESAVQLGNLARILNSFPRSMVKIGGYTDSTGNADLNFQLSEDRARVTMLALARRGVSASRLQSKGYGPRYFIMSNNSPIGRAVNRRVSIRVVEK